MLISKINIGAADLAKITIVVASFALTACSNKPTGTQIVDPNESVNRKTHMFNKSVDQAVFKPASELYAKVVSEEDDKIINNVVENLSTPKKAVNSLLQLDAEGFVINTLRFGINSTFGLVGYYDVAAEDFGIPVHDTDFGQTLDIWGFGEGKYVELPFLGPSTERDAVGKVADIFLDPLGSFFSDDLSKGVTVLKGVELVADRHQYADLIDPTLYESADSYAAQRIAYLQNRRFFLTGGISDDELEDPYADE